MKRTSSSRIAPRTFSSVPSREINADGKYKLIINASALIDADTTLNITPRCWPRSTRLYAADKKERAKITRVSRA